MNYFAKFNSISWKFISILALNSIIWFALDKISLYEERAFLYVEFSLSTLGFFLALTIVEIKKIVDEIIKNKSA